MSGHGGGGGGAVTPTLQCETISFSTDVNSPQSDAMAGLKIQEVLDLEIRNNTVVLIRRENKKILGSINWTSLLKLIECLNEGYKYVAIVRQIQGGLIKVQVSPVKGN